MTLLWYPTQEVIVSLPVPLAMYPLCQMRQQPPASVTIKWGHAERLARYNIPPPSPLPLRSSETLGGPTPRQRFFVTGL